MRKKVAVITGASRGIGKATAIKFAQEGYHLIISASKDKEGLHATKSEIERFGVQCFTFLSDMSEYQQVQAMFDEIKQIFGSIDIVINNAGISYVGLFTDMKPEEWTKLIDVNLKSVINCCHQAVPLMLRQGYGKIINISSVWGVCGASCEVVYSATKGAVNSFTKALGKELAPSNIQVNAIACGAINTSMNQCFTSDDLQALAEEIPAGRIGEPQEVADLVYALSTGNDYLNGQVIQFDGGWC